ncbi:MAG: ISAs1 family transposase, partial [Clostridia bacterium]
MRAQRIIGDDYFSEDRFYIASIEEARLVLHSVRTHWSVENQLHWGLDIAFDEDRSRIRKRCGAKNMAVLRHVALNVLQQADSCKRSIKNDYLLDGRM